ncbi:MAG: hypothetical protein V3W44_10525 [Dehalococcoidales bacterium]
MARIVSPVWSIIRGSIAGTTYFANQYHAIVARQRVAPTGGFGPYQQIMRSSFSGANATWETLTKDVQDDWDLYADGLVWSGPTGTYKVPGRQAFMAGRSLQNYANNRGLVVPNFVTTAPVTPGFLSPTNIAGAPPTGPGTGVGVTFTKDATDDTMAIVQISPPFDKERNLYNGPWNTRDAVAVINAAGSVVVEFLGLTLGKIHFIRISFVADDAAPRIAAPVIIRAIAVTVP